MKNLLTALIIVLSLSAMGQEMVVKGSNISMRGRTMTVTDASMMSMILTPKPRSIEANEHFLQARKLSAVNKFMTVAGLFQMVTGTVYISSSPLHSGVLFGTVKFGIGSVLVTNSRARVDERTLHILMGVEAYNKAIK